MSHLKTFPWHLTDRLIKAGHECGSGTNDLGHLVTSSRICSHQIRHLLTSSPNSPIILSEFCRTTYYLMATFVPAVFFSPSNPCATRRSTCPCTKDCLVPSYFSFNQLRYLFLQDPLFTTSYSQGLKALSLMLFLPPSHTLSYQIICSFWLYIFLPLVSLLRARVIVLFISISSVNRQSQICHSNQYLLNE